MTLLVDKHRPQKLSELDYHHELSSSLQQLAEAEDFPHLLFYGPSGAGKKTRILALLRQMYGYGLDKLKVEQRSLQIESKKKDLEVTMVYSIHHLEINPSDSGFNDRYVIQHVIKDIAQNKPIADSSAKQKPFKVVILNEIDKCTKEAQQSLRRTMEKYSPTCRLIMCCNNPSRVIEAVKSRCLCIRVGAPTVEQISSILMNISKKDKLSLPEDLAKRIAKLSDRNLRRAILMLETCKIKCFPFKSDQPVEKTDWEIFIDHVAKEIILEQSPTKLLAVRSYLYDLLTHCIPPSLVLKKLTEALIPKLDTSLKHLVIESAAFYEHRIQCGSKPIFHLEAFVAKFMSLYKAFLIHNFGE